jgi:hypothetical protein
LGSSGGKERKFSVWSSCFKCFQYRALDCPFGYLSPICTFLNGITGGRTNSEFTTTGSIIFLFAYFVPPSLLGFCPSLEFRLLSGLQNRSKKKEEARENEKLSGSSPILLWLLDLLGRSRMFVPYRTIVFYNYQRPD